MIRILLVLGFLVGCEKKEQMPRDKVSRADWEVAVQLCKPNDGLRELEAAIDKDGRWLFPVCNNDVLVLFYIPNSWINDRKGYLTYLRHLGIY